jgi:hypothetical protein
MDAWPDTTPDRDRVGERDPRCYPGLMPVSIRARILVATLILSFPFALGAVGLLAGDVPAFSLNDQVLACWIQVGVFGGAAVALATGRWWGRFLPLSIAWSFILSLLHSGGLGLPRLNTWLGVILLLCLSGRAMQERFEAKAPLPIDWTAPSMAIVRCALVITAAGLYGQLMDLLVLAREVRGLPLWHIDPPYSHCWPAWPCVTDAGDFLLLLGLEVVLMVGLVLLARQRTVALLLIAVAALVGTLLLVREIPVFQLHTPPLNMLLDLAPGLVLSWAAVIVWSRPVVRLLRGR